LIAWVEPSPGREAMGEPPAGWTVAEWPEDAAAAPDRDQVEFVVPNWEIVPDLAALPALKVVQSRSAGIDWIVDRIPEGVTLCSARGARDRRIQASHAQQHVRLRDPFRHDVRAAAGAEAAEFAGRGLERGEQLVAAHPPERRARHRHHAGKCRAVRLAAGLAMAMHEGRGLRIHFIRNGAA